VIKAMLSTGGEIEDQATFVLKKAEDDSSSGRLVAGSPSAAKAKSENNVSAGTDSKTTTSTKSLPTKDKDGSDASEVPKIKISDSKHSMYLSQTPSQNSTVLNAKLSSTDLSKSEEPISRPNGFSGDNNQGEMPDGLALALNILTPAEIERKRSVVNVKLDSPVHSIISAYSGDGESHEKESPAQSRHNNQENLRRVSDDVVARTSKQKLFTSVDENSQNQDEINYLMAFLGTTAGGAKFSAKRPSISSASTSGSSNTSLQKQNKAESHTSVFASNTTLTGSRADKLDYLLKSIEQVQKDNFQFKSGDSSLADVSNTSSTSSNSGESKKVDINELISVQPKSFVRDLNHLEFSGSVKSSTSSISYSKETVRSYGTLPGNSDGYPKGFPRTTRASSESLIGKTKALRDYFESKTSSQSSIRGQPLKEEKSNDDNTPRSSPKKPEKLSEVEEIPKKPTETNVVFKTIAK
jgi:hypothetical protein